MNMQFSLTRLAAALALIVVFVTQDAAAEPIPVAGCGVVPKGCVCVIDELIC